MSIASQITELGNDKTAIANAITTKGGTLSQNPGFDTFAADIETIPTGASEVESVNKFFKSGITEFTEDFFTGTTETQIQFKFHNYKPANKYTVYLPATYKTLKTQTFTQSALRYISLNSIETIEATCFAYCYDLPYIDIPLTVKAINSNTFGNSSVLTMKFHYTNDDNKLANLYLNGTCIPAATIQGSCFFIPSGMLQSYITKFNGFQSSYTYTNSNFAEYTDTSVKFYNSDSTWISKMRLNHEVIPPTDTENLSILVPTGTSTYYLNRLSTLDLGDYSQVITEY